MYEEKRIVVLTVPNTLFFCIDNRRKAILCGEVAEPSLLDDESDPKFPRVLRDIVPNKSISRKKTATSAFHLIREQPAG